VGSDTGHAACAGRAVRAALGAKATEQNHQDAGKLLILATPARAAIIVPTAQSTRNYW